MPFSDIVEEALLWVEWKMAGKKPKYKILKKLLGELLFEVLWPTLTSIINI
jgi:hypothetical protein